METQSSNFALWSGLGIFTGDDYFERVSNGFDKFYCFVFDHRLDGVSAFDLLLLYSFVVIFMAFLVASVFAIFEQDQRSLQEIKSKVKFSSAAIANLAAAFWAIRETKFKSISYEGYVRIIQNKQSLANLQTALLKADLCVEGDEIPKSDSSAKKQCKRNRTPRRDYSPLLTKNTLLPKIGKAIMPQQKKLSGLFNTGPKNKSLRAAPSSTSTRLKPSGSRLIPTRSQCVIVEKAAYTPRICRKTVHIDEAVKVH